MAVTKIINITNDFSSHRGKIITLIGPDGCGKSTVLEKLKKIGYLTSSWKGLRNVQQFKFHCWRAQLFPEKYRSQLPPYSRALFVLSAIFAEYEFQIKPFTDVGKDVIVDSYYIRPLAKEIVKGKSILELLKFATILPKPNLAVLFKVNLGESYKRKGNPSEYEVLKSRTFPDYCFFQEQVMRTCLEILDKESILYTSIDANKSIEEVYNDVLDIMQQFSHKSVNSSPIYSIKEN